MTARVTVAVVVAVLLAACGVPQDEAPRALDPSAAPFLVFEPEPAPQPQGEVEAELWLVRTDRLVPVQRQLRLPGSPQQILEQLFDGPTEAERAAGLSSALPAALELEDIEVRNRLAVVTLEGLGDQVRTDANVAFGQIVATLDAHPDIDGVRFRTPDGDVQVPRGDGSLTDAPVNRESYAELIGDPQTTSVVPPQPVAPIPEPAPAQPAAGESAAEPAAADPAAEPAAAEPAPPGG